MFSFVYSVPSVFDHVPSQAATTRALYQNPSWTAPPKANKKKTNKQTLQSLAVTAWLKWYLRTIENASAVITA